MPHTVRQPGRRTPARGEWRSWLFAVALVLSACLLVVAVKFPAYGWTAWLSLVPLFLAIRRCSPGLALLAGAVWGYSLCLFGFLEGIGGAAPSLAAIIGFTAIPAVYAAIGSLLTRRIGFSPLVLAVGWIVVELAMAPLGWSHGLLAGTQAGDGTLMTFVGGVLGSVYVAFLVAYVNALLLRVAESIPFRLPQPHAYGEGKRLARVLPQDDTIRGLETAHRHGARAPPAFAFARVRGR